MLSQATLHMNILTFIRFESTRPTSIAHAAGAAPCIPCFTVLALLCTTPLLKLPGTVSTSIQQPAAHKLMMPNTDVEFEGNQCY